MNATMETCKWCKAEVPYGTLNCDLLCPRCDSQRSDVRVAVLGADTPRDAK